MPEYFPQVQMPQGMAETIARLLMQRGQNMAQGIQSAAQSVGQGIAGMGEAIGRRRASTISPEQAKALGISTSVPATPLAPDAQGNVPQREMFPKGVPVTLAEKILAAREATARTVGAAEIRAAAQGGRATVPLTDAGRTLFKEAGLPVDANATEVSHADYDAALKKVLETKREGAAKDRASQSVSIKDEQLLKKQWVQAGKDLDIGTASSRSPLGVAVTNNQKAARAMKLLGGKGKLTPQDLSLITTDLTAMMKGGSPDEELLRQQQYPSVYKDAIEMVQRLTSSPKDLDVPEVRQHLKEVIKGIVQVDNQVIRDHVDSSESKYMDAAAWRPKEWEKMKSKALKHVVEDEGTSGIDALIDKHMGGAK